LFCADDLLILAIPLFNHCHDGRNFVEGSYAELCARLVPKDVQLTIGQRLPGGLEPDDWALVMEIMGAIKQTLPDAGSQPPGQVLEFVASAIRAHSSPLIDNCPENDGPRAPSNTQDEPVK
jgi:hypothetical protein